MNVSNSPTFDAASVGAPLQGTLNIAGPEVYSLAELSRITLEATGSARHVVVDESAGLFAAVKGEAIIAPEGAVLATTVYRDRLNSR